jgi:hypothetical protein
MMKRDVKDATLFRKLAFFFSFENDFLNFHKKRGKKNLLSGWVRTSNNGGQLASQLHKKDSLDSTPPTSSILTSELRTKNATDIPTS